MIIKVTRPQDMHALYTRAKNDAEKHGIKWTGDMQQGHGSGFGFEGRYVVDANYITVTVLKKPLFVTKARVEREIKQYVSQVS